MTSFAAHNLRIACAELRIKFFQPSFCHSEVMTQAFGFVRKPFAHGGSLLTCAQLVWREVPLKVLGLLKRPFE
jgi:hypothetical protein